MNADLLYRDPVGDAALTALDSRRGPTPDLEFQCRACHATGTTADVARWVQLAPGRFFHVRARRIQPEPCFGDAAAVFRVERKRKLCGEARQLTGRKAVLA